MTLKPFTTTIPRVHFYVLIALIVNFLFCEYNFKKLCSDELQTKTQKLTFHQKTIHNIDNKYYNIPPENFIKGKGWRVNPAIGEAGYIRRVPGYSTVYFVFRATFSEANYLLILRCFQFLLFGISCFTFLGLARYFVNEKMALTIALLYSILPVASVWTYFTLTEAITPAFMIFYIYFLIKGCESLKSSSKLLFYSISFLMLVSLILTRPYVGLSGILFAVALLTDLKHRKITFLQATFTTLIGFTVWSTWIIRNYSITGDFIPLEIAYHPQSVDRMKPEFRGMFNLSKARGEDGAYFNTYHEPFFNAVLHRGYSEQNNELVLKKLPERTINELGKSNLIEVLNSHQLAILAQSDLFLDSNTVHINYLPIQHSTERKYNHLIDKIKSDNSVHFYFTARLKYLQRIIVHSNTAHIHVFNRSMNLMLKGMKAGLFVFHILGYLFIVLGFFVFFKNRKTLPFMMFTVTPLIFVFFFAFVHREVEQRYMLPIYPLIVLGMAWCYSEGKKLLTSRQ